MTKINKLFLLCCLFLSLGIVNAQPSNYQFFATAPQPVSGVSASVVGQQGQGSTYYYWVVAEYPIGMSLAAGPGIATNAAITLSGSNFNRVNWVGQTGATGYTVLRTATNTAPFNAGNTCTCAVVVGTGGTTVDDVGSALSGFTLTPAGSATGRVYLDNLNFSQPRIVIEPTLTVTGFFDKATYVLCNGVDCTTGINLTNEYLVVRVGALESCQAFAKVAPVGADLVIDINNSGTAVSIFGATKLVIADGTNLGTQATFNAPGTVALTDRLTVDIDQIGSGTAGQTVTVVCTWTFTN